MGWTTGTTSLTKQIKVKFDRVDHVAVYNSASDAISASVPLIFNAGEEVNMVPPANDDEGDSRLETQLDTSISNEREFFLENRSELSFGDPTAIEQDALGILSRCASVLFQDIYAHGPY